jgi:excisionase family DNA binding protein
MAAKPRTVTLQEAAQQLGLHYMTVYRYVRTGKLPATQDGLIWRIRVSDVNALKDRGVTAKGSRSRRTTTTGTSRALEARLLAGDSAGAWWLIESRLGGGLDPTGVLTTLLAPALRSIGTKWADGDVSVADEHRATAVSQRIIGRLGLQFGRPGRSRGTVIVAAPAGDLHTLPVAMVADLLRWRGFDVAELGANTPDDALAEVAGKADRLVAVGIASTTLGLDAEVRLAIEKLRTTSRGAPTLLGGSAIRSGAHARKLGADIWTGRYGWKVVETVESLVDAGRMVGTGNVHV